MQKKIAVFLYPIDEYVRHVPAVEHAVARQGERVLASYAVKMEEVIRERFRRHGWSVVWVLFAVRDHSKVPDLSLVSSVFPIQPSDQVISARISFRTHVERKVYPDPNIILDELDPVNRLAVCGFHNGDCVDTFAEIAYQRGIKVKVHEDLTEFFFNLVDNGLLKRFCTKLFPQPVRRGGFVYTRWQELRRKKPWRWQWR